MSLRFYDCPSYSHTRWSGEWRNTFSASSVFLCSYFYSSGILFVFVTLSVFLKLPFFLLPVCSFCPFTFFPEKSLSRSFRVLVTLGCVTGTTSDRLPLWTCSHRQDRTISAFLICPPPLWKGTLLSSSICWMKLKTKKSTTTVEM